jgi:hypothetical protein
MNARQDKKENNIGDGKCHVEPIIFDFSEFSFIDYKVAESNTTESVYVTYTNSQNGKSVTVRFSWHVSNAVEFGDQLNGNIATKEEVLYYLGLAKRTFVAETYLFIQKRSIKKSEVKNFEEAELTISEMYELGEGADLSAFVGKLAKGSNYLIEGNKVERKAQTTIDKLGRVVSCGKYIYE